MALGLDHPDISALKVICFGPEAALGQHGDAARELRELHAQRSDGWKNKASFHAFHREKDM